MRVRKAQGEFLVGARQEGRSIATVRQYGWHLERLAVWLEEKGVRELEDVDRSMLREWGAGLRDEWAPSTVKQAVCASRAWLRWCHEEGWIGEDPGRALRVPRVPRRIQRVLSVAEIGQMVAACDGSVRGIRDLALVSVLVDSGLRSAELCRLKVADVDLERGVLVVEIKGGSDGYGYLGDVAVERVRAWLGVRLALSGVEEMFVAVGGGRPGRELTTSGLRSVLRRLGARAGVEGVSPHAFRRSFACVMTEAGAPSRVVQLAGRWSNIQMVELYTSGLQAGRIVKQWSAADWIENNGAER